jgi:hypothetical protein
MNRLASNIPNAGSGIDTEANVFDAPYAVNVLSASGAIPLTTQGYCPITKAGVAVLTLPAPVAGLPSAGGNDGQTIEFADTTGNAHTITTPALKINGAYDTFTFAGHLGNTCKFTAYNGIWYTAIGATVTAAAGGTLSEV